MWDTEKGERIEFPALQVNYTKKRNEAIGGARKKDGRRWRLYLRLEREWTQEIVFLRPLPVFRKERESRAGTPTKRKRAPTVGLLFMRLFRHGKKKNGKPGLSCTEFGGKEARAEPRGKKAGEPALAQPARVERKGVGLAPSYQLRRKGGGGRSDQKTTEKEKRQE